MFRTKHTLLSFGAAALLTWILFAALHDVWTVLWHPAAPYFAFMSP